ncbi:MAG TPA: ParB/RepB/Spo0J family partition protein [Candidatus Omnitrophota bacterium]|nr:ParB/RepB/Spo0J family partition protein [Candidatus Omnitrophota bacterium]HRY85621.1 ParB/RepB/Spo0J family partition protein [Candidatus Omnitrophota bacterium]
MKKALGKGLSALIPDSYKDQMAAATLQEMPAATVTVEPEKAAQKTTVFSKTAAFQLIPISRISSNANQPRKTFNTETIEELADSIREKGVLQPVIVKQKKDGNYELVCGERRFRAATLCGLQEVPAIIKDVANEDFLEWALIENIQREDLNPIEEAEAYQRLAEERAISQEEVAKRVGKNRATVANTLRLLRLPSEIKQYLIEGRLSAGHARALLGLLTPEHQRHMAKRIVEENLSVRQVEAIVNRSNAHKRKAKTARHLSAEIVDLETRLTHFLGTQAKLYPRKNQKEGRIEIQYFSLDDLDRVLQKIGLPKN